MKRSMQILLILLGLLCILGCQQNLPPGITSKDMLPKDGEYYIVNGPDMKNLDKNLIGEKIRFDGRISRKTNLLKGGSFSLDGVYYVRFTWDSSHVPTDMSEQLNKGGLQEGSRLRIWGSIDFIDEGAKRENLIGPSCHLTVERWEHIK